MARRLSNIEVPPHGSDGHFFVGAADAVPIWSPLVGAFLDKQK
jgi:hypothetical protein